MEFNMTETLKELLNRLFEAQLDHESVVIGYDSTDETYSIAQSTEIKSYKYNNGHLAVFGDHEKVHTIVVGEVVKDGDTEFYIVNKSGTFSILFG